MKNTTEAHFRQRLINYAKLKMYCLEEGQKQLAVYQKKSKPFS